MARYGLTDFERSVIVPLLPQKSRGVPRVDDRRVLNGIFWVLRSGAPWADLPGQDHDASAAAPLLIDLQDGQIILGDKAYDADWIRRQIEDQGAAPNIPDRSNRKPRHCFCLSGGHPNRLPIAANTQRHRR